MVDRIVEKHQLAGVDERDRGFNRLVELERVEAGCRAVLRYEVTRVETLPCETQAEALGQLIVMLQSQGYTQLRSRLSFQGATYLGSQRDWIEYPDRERPSEHRGSLSGWLHRLRQSFGF